MLLAYLFRLLCVITELEIVHPHHYLPLMVVCLLCLTHRLLYLIILHIQLLQAGTRGSILQWQIYTTYTASTGRNMWLNPAVTNIYYIHSFYRQEHVAQSCSDKHILHTQLLQAGTRGSILQWQTYTTYTASTGRNTWLNPAVTNIYCIHSFYRQEHVVQSCSDKHILHTQLLQAGTRGSILQWQTYTTYTASTGRNMWLNPAVTNIYYIHSFYRQEHVAQYCSDKHILHTQLLQAGTHMWFNPAVINIYYIHSFYRQEYTCGSILQWQTYTTYTASTGRNTWLNPAVTNIYYIHSFYRQEHVAQSCSDKHILHTQLLQAGTCGSILQWQTYTTYIASTGRNTWLNPAVTNIYYIHSFYRQEHVAQSYSDKYILHTQLLQTGTRGSILQWQTYTTYTASTGRNTHVVQSCSDKHILHTQLLQAGTRGSILQWQTYTTYTASTGRNTHVVQSCRDKHILHTQLLQAGTRGSILQWQTYTTYTASTGRNMWLNPAVTNIYYIHRFYRQEHVAQSCRDKRILHTQLLQAGTRGSILQWQTYTTYTASTGRNTWLNPAGTNIYYIHSFYRQEHVAQSCRDKHILHTQLLQAGTCGSILQWQTYTTYIASTGRNTWLNPAVTNIYYIHSFYRQEHVAQSCSDKHILHTQLLQAGTRGSIMQGQTYTTYTASTGRNTWLNPAGTNIYYIHSFYRQEHVAQSCSHKHILHTQLLQAGTRGSILQGQTYTTYTASTGRNTWLNPAVTNIYYIHSFYRQEHVAQSCSDKHILHTQLLQAGTRGSIMQWQTYTTYTASTGRNTWLNHAVTNIYYIHSFYRQEHVAQSCSDKHILHTQLLQAGTRGSILLGQTYTTYTASTGRKTWLNPAGTNIYYVHSFYRQEHVAQSCSDKHILHTQLLRELGCIHTFKVKHEFAKKCLKYNLPKLINDTPKRVKDKINTHSLKGFINYGKNDMIHKYSNICIVQHCYICQQSQLHL